MTPWTADRTEQLKLLWAEGYSGKRIAAMLGGISRSSAIAKAHRLGLPKRETKFVFEVVRKPRPKKSRKRRRHERPLTIQYEPSKNELYAMLRQAVINTGGV